MILIIQESSDGLEAAKPVKLWDFQRLHMHRHKHLRSCVSRQLLRSPSLSREPQIIQLAFNEPLLCIKNASVSCSKERSLTSEFALRVVGRGSKHFWLESLVSPWPFPCFSPKSPRFSPKIPTTRHKSPEHLEKLSRSHKATKGPPWAGH